MHRQKLSGPAIFALISAIVLWGSSPVAIRAGLVGYGPSQLALFRFGLAALIFVFYALVRKVRLPQRGDWPIIILAAGSGITFYNIILSHGLLTVSAGTTSFLIASTPIWTLLIAMVALGERLAPWGWFGVLVSFAGITLIASEKGRGIHFAPGALLILSGTIAYGVYQVLQKRLLHRYTAFEFTFYSFCVGSILMVPLGRGVLTQIRTAPLHATLAVIYLAIFPAAIANFAWSYSLTHVPASRLATFFYAMPVATLGIAWVWLGEVPTVLSLTGGTLALAGVAIVNLWGQARIGEVEVKPMVPEVVE